MPQILLSTDIRFPNLGMVLKNVPSGFTVFGYRIALYGVVISIGMLLGLLLASWMAKRTGQKTDIYLDLALIGIVVSVIFTRLFYVIFSWDEYKNNLWEIFNLRDGGLMIYGGIIGALLTAVIFARVRKYPLWLLLDTGCLGLITGQIIGRWGNFFNREVFGRYTDSLFAMQLNIKDTPYDYRMPLAELQAKYAGRTSVYNNIVEIRNKIINIGGADYVQVHPTFLYESLWNLGLLIFLILYTKHKKFDGEIILLYLAIYGVGRFWIEGMRTDQLFLWGTAVPISQLISAVLVIASAAMIIYKRIKAKSAVKE